MSKIIAYCRVSTKKQLLENQENLILKYCHDNKLFIDEWVRLEHSGKSKESEKKMNYIFDRLESGDILIISEISRIGRSTGFVVSFIDKIVAKGARLIVLKQGIDISKDTSNMASKLMVSMFSMVAEVERDLISERTIMALDRIRAEGKTLGRPKGSRGKSKLDGREDEIKYFLENKVSVRAISRLMKCTDTCLRHFLKTRKIPVQN